MKLTFQRIKDYGAELYEEACFESERAHARADADQARALTLPL